MRPRGNVQGQSGEECRAESFFVDRPVANILNLTWLIAKQHLGVKKAQQPPDRCGVSSHVRRSENAVGEYDL
jgi:hypothetical protein